VLPPKYGNNKLSNSLTHFISGEFYEEDCAWLLHYFLLKSNSGYSLEFDHQINTS
jgi:hypothetical protein